MRKRGRKPDPAEMKQKAVALQVSDITLGGGWDSETDPDA